MIKRQLPDTDIYAILSAAHSSGRGNIEVARLLLEGGIRIIQYREKDLPASLKLAECLSIRNLCRQYDACFTVNDEPDLAVAVAAHGLHLGQSDLLPEKARKIVGDRMIVGLSVTNASEIDAAIGNPSIDYLGVGPIFDATSTKSDAAAAGGLELLDYALKRVNLPIIAIGGINITNVADVVRHGAQYVAMISGLISAEDIPGRVAQIRAVIESVRHS